ncbi:MAG: putative lytic transglycosylase [uncultured marine phage]|uniref:Putative lytic transglycosylase n=1 Tax=uncultured marine phage TaxID=707152 RepID=A0A8D9FRJ4_9VIRU|nr:MAG: putative lytic transglycosylase [uncultured marine phage]
MVRKLAERLYNKMVISTASKYKFYEKYVRWGIINVLERYLNPEIYSDTRWKKFKRTTWDLRVPIMSLMLLSGVLGTFFIFGSISRNSEISELDDNINVRNKMLSEYYEDKVELQSIIDKKDVKIDSLYNYFETREYIEYVIFSQAKIDDFELNMSRVSDEILFLMWEQCNKYNIPYTIYFRLIDKESGFKFIANHGGSGAFGYMQVMPATFRSYAKILGLKGGHTEENNILVGSYMLNKNYKYWKSKGRDDRSAWRFTLAEYNAGQGNMQVYNSDSTKVIGHYIPSYTLSYINFIMKYYED